MNNSVEESEAITLLNKTGFPFQDRVASTIKEAGSYHYEVEVPYSIPEMEVGGTADIIAVWYYNQSSLTYSPFQGNIFLVIEAKRANPKSKNWIFIKDNHKEYRRFQSPSFISKTADEIQIERRLTFPELNYSRDEDYERCIQAFEFDSAYRINNDTENKVYKPLLQVHQALCGFATKGPVIQSRSFQNEKNEYIYLPVVVTTAKLFTAEYDPANVTLSEGELREDGATIKNVPWLTHEFPLPEVLKSIGGTYEGTWAEKLTTFVVNGEHWKEFLQKACVVYGKNSSA